MKVIIYTKYGPPDVLQLKEVEKPVPKGNEVLVKVRAASVNPLDWHFMRGAPFIVRLLVGFLKPKHKYRILGADLSGQVEAVGRSVGQFKPGDEIFGGSSNLGAFAQYACNAEDQVVLKPARTTFEEAAAVGVAALTALQGLRDKGQIQPGHKVLINGASGGVGTFAVQIAKSFGAEVTGVCSTRNLDIVRSIGADQVVDYTVEDFTENGGRYDLIFDAVGNRALSDCKRALSPNGIFVAAAGSLGRALWISMTGGKKMVSYIAKSNKKDLVVLQALIDTGKVTPVIDRRYKLSETPEAMRYLEEGHARGKVVITIEDDDKT